ncbi:MAG: porin [Gemmatimonadota bacterium]
MIGLPAVSRITQALHAPQLTRSLLVVLLGLALPPAPGVAQSEPEPVLEQLRAVFDQPGLKVGVLLQAVADPGLDDETARMQVANARLRVSGELDGGFRYDLQTNFAGSPALLDARVGWSSGPGFAVDAGRFKTPFSGEFLIPASSIDFVDRARVVQALAPNRQVGVRLSGRLDEYVSWAAGGFTGSSNSVPGEPLIGVFRVDGSSFELGEGLLSVGVHAATGKDGGIAPRFAAFRGDGVLLGIDGRYESGRLLLSGEYVRADWDPNVGADQDADGLYLTGGWHLEENHQVLARWDRYRGPGAGVEPDDALILGYNVWPTSASEIQVNGIFPLRDSTLPYRLLVNFQIGF